MSTRSEPSVTPTCKAVSNVREGQGERAYLRGAKDSPIANKTFSVDRLMGDNHAGFQNFGINTLNLTANVCSTHLTAITKNTGKHQQYFKSPGAYAQFYEYMVRVIKCPWLELADKLPDIVVAYLREDGQPDDPAGTETMGECQD